VGLALAFLPVFLSPVRSLRTMPEPVGLEDAEGEVLAGIGRVPRSTLDDRA
jgi:hypothetical protein